MITQGSKVVTKQGTTGYVGYIYPSDKSFRLYRNKQSALADKQTDTSYDNVCGNSFLHEVTDVTPIDPPTFKPGDWVYVKNGHVFAGRRGDFFGYIGEHLGGKCYDIYGNPNKTGLVGSTDSESTVLLVSDKPTEMVWFDRNGKGWLPQEMTEEHLKNCLEFCRIRLSSVQRNNAEAQDLHGLG